MVLELKITCACHQAKIAVCCQTPLVALFARKIYSEGFFSVLNPNCNQICCLTPPGTQALLINQQYLEKSNIFLLLLYICYGFLLRFHLWANNNSPKPLA